MVATVLTLIFSLAADWRTSCKVSTSEIVGLVLAIMTTVVKPPAAAARAPDGYPPCGFDQVHGNEHEYRPKPGATTRPLASMMSTPSL